MKRSFGLLFEVLTIHRDRAKPELRLLIAIAFHIAGPGPQAWLLIGLVSHQQ